MPTDGRERLTDCGECDADAASGVACSSAPMRRPGTASSCRPDATPTARATTPASACGATSCRVGDHCLSRTRHGSGTPRRWRPVDFQSKKEDSETKVGNAMNLEGGLGGDFLKGGLTVGGSDYYASFKLTGRPHRRISRHPHPRQEQGVRARAGSPAGDREEQYALRLREGRTISGKSTPGRRHRAVS